MSAARFAQIIKREQNGVLNYHVEMTRPRKGLRNWESHDFDTISSAVSYLRRFKKIEVTFSNHLTNERYPILTEMDWMEMILCNP